MRFYLSVADAANKIVCKKCLAERGVKIVAVVRWSEELQYIESKTLA